MEIKTSDLVFILANLDFQHIIVEKKNDRIIFMHNDTEREFNLEGKLIRTTKGNVTEYRK